MVDNSQRRWRARLLIALAVLVALAVGLALGTWIAAPHYPDDASAEAGFARDMSTHHGQAVEMAIVEWEATGNAELKTMSLDIITTQQGQIGQMHAWLDTWGLSPTGDAPSMAWMGHDHGGEAPEMPGMATKAQLDELRAATGTDKDILFCELMIAHHEGGVDMADAVLEHSDDRQVRALAEGIKVSQRGEIAALTRIKGALQAAR